MDEKFDETFEQDFVAEDGVNDEESSLVPRVLVGVGVTALGAGAAVAWKKREAIKDKVRQRRLASIKKKQEKLARKQAKLQVQDKNPETKNE